MLAAVRLRLRSRGSAQRLLEAMRRAGRTGGRSPLYEQKTDRNYLALAIIETLRKGFIPLGRPLDCAVLAVTPF